MRRAVSLCTACILKEGRSPCSCMQSSLRTDQKLFHLTVSTALPTLCWLLATATTGTTPPGRVTALLPVLPDEFPQLEAAKEDFSLPRMLDAEDNCIKLHNRESYYESLAPQRKRRKNEVTRDWYKY